MQTGIKTISNVCLEEELCHHMKIFVHVNPENNEEKEDGCHKVVHDVNQEQDRHATYTTSLQHTIESSDQRKETSQQKEIRTSKLQRKK
jgi:hypothetical protein